MSAARFVLAFLLALLLMAPASARPLQGSAGWTTDGWVSYSGVLYSGPGTQYDQVGTIAADVEIRVDRCSKRWCEIRTGSERGWISLDHVSFGQEPDGLFRGPQFDFGHGGQACFYEGENFTGASFCASAGRVIHDLALIGGDNRISSIELNGGSVLACRDRGFRSYCERINESKSRVDGLLNNSISAIRVY